LSRKSTFRSVQSQPAKGQPGLSAGETFMNQQKARELNGMPLRVLHSFPHRLGMSRICTSAWHEIESAAAAGADLLVMAGDCVRPFQQSVRVKTTLAYGKLRLPYRILGARRMCMLHDWLVARQLPRLAGKIDVIHAWPLAALKTIQTARGLGIPVALERCNAHTRFAYEVVRQECERIGVPLPPGHEHAYDERILQREEAEYRAAHSILCPSSFVEKTFLEQGYPLERLARFIYGVDEKQFFPSDRNEHARTGLNMIFVGVCAVRKGLHFALEAWLRSGASKTGRFLVVGEFIPEYRKKLEPLLKHPSVRVLGHRNDVPALMRDCDVFVLPSIEEGFGLVCTEAMASGCVPLVSDACTELCRHGVNALVHMVGAVDQLTAHIDRLNQDRALLASLRSQGVAERDNISWTAAGRSLVTCYRNVVANSSK
jgi:glycosyltransferase involved in cell wall biosynthesis